MKRIDVFDELKRLRREVEQERRLRRQWQRKYSALKKELDDVKKLLNQLLNANTPSSQLPPQFKPTSEPRPENGTNPRGKPKGSNGATKEAPDKIDKKVKVTIPKKCRTCGTKLRIEHYTRLVYDIPQITVSVTEFDVEEGQCNYCNTLYVGTHPELPEHGMIGPNLQVFFTELKHNFAGSYGRIATFFEEMTGVGFSHTTINDCVKRVATQLEPSYKKLEQETRNAAYAHSDETSWPLNGKQWWLWLLITATTSFITIQPSRARKVLTQLFGSRYDGVIISDCFKVYDTFAAAFQKDWVHLLRKTHFEAGKYPTRNVVRLHEELSSLYTDIQGFVATNPSFEQRVWQSIVYHQKLQRLRRHRWMSTPAQNIVNNWLKQYEGQWLVGVIMPEISLDNNIDERGIRKVIPTRKLLGGHRTDKGARNFAIIETHRQTWKLRNEAPYHKLVEYLKECNINAGS